MYLFLVFFLRLLGIFFVYLCAILCAILCLLFSLLLSLCPSSCPASSRLLLPPVLSLLSIRIIVAHSVLFYDLHRFDLLGARFNRPCLFRRLKIHIKHQTNQSKA